MAFDLSRLESISAPLASIVFSIEKKTYWNPGISVLNVGPCLPWTVAQS